MGRRARREAKRFWTSEGRASGHFEKTLPSAGRASAGALGQTSQRRGPTGGRGKRDRPLVELSRRVEECSEG